MSRAEMIEITADGDGKAKRKSPGKFQGILHLAEQEGFELELWLAIIRNYQPL